MPTAKQIVEQVLPEAEMPSSKVPEKNIEWNRIPAGANVYLRGKPGSESYCTDDACAFWSGSDAARAQGKLEQMVQATKKRMAQKPAAQESAWNEDDMGVRYDPTRDELRCIPTGGGSHAIVCRRGFEKFKQAERTRGPKYDSLRWEGLEKYSGDAE